MGHNNGRQVKFPGNGLDPLLLNSRPVCSCVLFFWKLPDGFLSLLPFVFSFYDRIPPFYKSNLRMSYVRNM